ncbi:MAG: hypothetical protein V4481_01030 [Patescibacteria group bacterium]
MNKKIIGFIIVVLVIIGIIWAVQSSKSTPSMGGETATSTPTVSVPDSETTKVSGGLSEFQNAELGFSVKYPNTWEVGKNDSGVTFLIPIDKTQVSTVAKLQSDVKVSAGKCAFPPVTTIKDRATVTVKGKSFNTISMSNNVQGRAYFDRMYSLQKDSICYMFSFSSITQSAASKNLTGSNATQAENNNKAIINAADASFTDMVKSFEFVTGPQGVDETKASPKQ